MIITSRYEKCQRVAHRLNAEAYQQQAANAKRLPLRQFVPCAKADVYIRACSTQQVMSEIENEAAMTPCSCHPSVGIPELIDMEYDASCRLWHGKGV